MYLCWVNQNGRDRRTADIHAVHQIEDYQFGMNGMAKRTSKTSAKVAKKATNNNQAGIQLGICDLLFFLKAVLDSIRGPIN